MGLALRYSNEEDGGVGAVFVGHAALEGYPGFLHGGVVTGILDGAMVHCLFARGIRALTAELRVRFHAPLLVGEAVIVRAWHVSSTHGLHGARAEAIQGGRVCARAQGKFLPPR